MCVCVCVYVCLRACVRACLCVCDKKQCKRVHCFPGFAIAPAMRIINKVLCMCYATKETQSMRRPCQECGSRIRARVISMWKIQTPSIPSLKKRENLRSKCVRSQREPRGLTRGGIITHTLDCSDCQQIPNEEFKFQKRLQGDSEAGTYVRTGQKSPAGGSNDRGMLDTDETYG